MVTRSFSLNTSGDPEDPKFGKAKPSGFGTSPVLAFSPFATGTVTDEPAPPPPPQAASANPKASEAGQNAA
jgi:hypothetical protein